MEWKLTSSDSKKSTLLNSNKSKKPKKSGALGSKKVQNVDFAKLEKESKSVAADQVRNKQFEIAAKNNANFINSSNSNIDSNLGNTTTINSKPVSKERRNQTAARLGMGGNFNTNSKPHISSHVLDFQELRKNENINNSSNNSSGNLNSQLLLDKILDKNKSSSALENTNSNFNDLHSSNMSNSPFSNSSSMSAQQKIDSNLLIKLGMEDTRMRLDDIMTNSTDISDLLGKNCSLRKNNNIEEDNNSAIEYDQHGLVLK